ncbi:tRNA1(Val) (adenine(37)-N6)-methyltransferase [Parasediminibacterium sp. JCM 36343]|uniref:tRNA1(Val) (adenine(37)-N6)-methyltransferase n=1 Tax=Parasediminibacterium sp. JCM 36343 TaxID=3374279 RepID=UPI00397DEB72
MPNNYFQFKQFTVYQQHCAMKVTTDACLFGAWVGNCINEGRIAFNQPQGSFLDIGTGTGLLSLMLSQNAPDSHIDAVEIDKLAAQQATENFASSPWHKQLQVHYTSIQAFCQGNTSPLYDFIISNPPFFDNDLKSNNFKKNLAMHSEALSLEALLVAIQTLLLKDGSFAILLPYHRCGYFEGLAIEAGFHLSGKALVKQTPTHPFFRAMLLFSYATTVTICEEITIKEANEYTPVFLSLLQAYYL